MKKYLAMLLALVMMLSIFAGCTKAPTPPDETDPPKQTDAPETTAAPEETAPPESETPLKLAWNQGIGVDTMFENPQRDYLSMYPFAIFETLGWKETATKTWQPKLAAEWGSNADYTEWWFTIRDDVTWHDGTPFTMDDVVFSIMSATLNPVASGVYRFKHVIGQEALVNGETDKLEGMSVDGNTITFKLTDAQAKFDGNVLNTWILPSHLLSDSGYTDLDNDDFWKKPVGTGPYKIVDVSFPDYFTATRYEDYWGEKASIKNLLFTSFATGGSDASIAALINGDLDYLQSNMVPDLAAAESAISQNSDLTLRQKSAYSTRFMYFNMLGRADGEFKEDLVKNPKFRKAIDLLLDEETFASFYPNQATATHAFFPASDPEYNPNCPDKFYDPVEAKKLLDEIGFDYDTEITLAYYYDDQTTKDIMMWLESSFAENGVKLKTVLLAGDLTIGIYEDMNYELLYAAGGSTEDLPATLYGEFRSTNNFNFLGTMPTSAVYEDLMAKYFAELDMEKRKDIAWKMQEQSWADTYGFPVYTKDNIEVFNAAHVELPESIKQTYHVAWDEWKILH